MRKIVLLILFILSLACISFAQTDTIYYNIHWDKTTKDSASYFRIAELQSDKKYFIQDHYLYGQVQMTGFYTCPEFDNQCKSGHFVYYDSIGLIKSEGEIIGGRYTGIWKYYYNNSVSLKATTIRLDDNGMSQIVLYDSTTHKKIAAGNLLNEKKDGTWEYFYSNDGAVKSKVIFSDGLREGEAFEYDAPTHAIIVKGKYLHDKKTGAWGYYTPTGILYGIMNFQDGMQDGTAVFYDTLSHKKRLEFNFHNGKREGKGIGYYPNGNKVYALNFKEDKLDGDQTLYYANGTIKRAEHYTEGVLTSGKCFDEAGNSIPYFPQQITGSDTPVSSNNNQ
jgi:antitoxin component YwqK of YwqJK toxin-antitoxin module